MSDVCHVLRPYAIIMSSWSCLTITTMNFLFCLETVHDWVAFCSTYMLSPVPRLHWSMNSKHTNHGVCTIRSWIYQAACWQHDSGIQFMNCNYWRKCRSVVYMAQKRLLFALKQSMTSNKRSKRSPTTTPSTSPAKVSTLTIRFEIKHILLFFLCTATQTSRWTGLALTFQKKLYSHSS